MTMKNIKRIRGTVALAVMAMGLGLSACTDVLVEPQDRISGENVFDEPQAYTAFLAKLYAGLAVSGQQGPAGNNDIGGIDEGFGQYLRGYWQLQELPTDEAVISWGDAGLPELVTDQWGSTNQFIAATYYRLFYQITLANEFLRQTTESQLAERGHTAENLLPGVDIVRYRAEARFLRALSYWHAIDLFGDIPFVDETSSVGGAAPEQADRAVVFAFIESELEDIMPDLMPIGTAPYGRADEGAALMLMAKLMLNAEVYGAGNRATDALAAADELINSGAYELDDEFQELFLADNNTSPEIIFPIAFDGTRTQTWGGTTYLVAASIIGDMDPEDSGTSQKWNGLHLTQQAVAFFPGGTSGSDDRADIIYRTGQDSVVADFRDGGDGYGYPKFKNVTSTGGSGSHPTHMDTDFPLFRLADAMLIYAEACFRSGGGACEADAETYVNEVRDRADADGGDVDFSAMTDAQALDYILEERGRELMWEGHRRQDLIRYGLFTGGEYLWAFKGGPAEGQAIDDFLNVYPIPANEIIANPNLDQNPGY
jgi:starch-binding outer membrane protein, SusD/RagB family